MPPAVALAAGIVGDSVWAAGPGLYLAGFAIGSLLLIVPVVRRRGAVIPLVIAAACAGGLLHHNAYRRVAANHIVHRLSAGGAPVARVRGTVVTTPRVAPRATGPFAPWMYSPDRTSFLLEADSVEQDTGFVPVSGRMRVTVKEAVMDLAVGDRVALFGRLYRPGPPDNPGQFDWCRWQRRHGVLVGMSCNYRESAGKLESGPSGSWSSWLGRLRQRVRGLLLDEMLAVGGPETSLLDAMILARRTAIDPSLDEAFIRTGCAHYLAASGIHVGMLAFFLYALGRSVGIAQRWSALCIILATAGYAVLAEPRPAIFRAAVLTIAICISLMIRRRGSSLNWLALSGVLFLVWRPMELFDAGFQLSYACVAGILLLEPPIMHLLAWVRARLRRALLGDLTAELREAPDRKGRWGHLRAWGALSVAVALAAWLSALPLVLFHFQRFSPWGWLNTLLVFPPVAVVMFAGFGTLLVGLLSPWLAGLLTLTVRIPAVGLVWWVTLLGKAPAVTLYTPMPAVTWVLLYYAVLGAWIVVHRAPARPDEIGGCLSRTAEARPRKRRNTHVWPAAIVITTGWLVVTIIWLLRPGPSGRLTMTVLSVGRGTSIVIELPEGGAVLYDAGCSGSYDPGATAIVPFLTHRGIERVETAIISHPNLDHFGGLPSVADRVEIGSVMLNPQFEELSPSNKPSCALLQELRQRNLPIELIDSSAGSFEIGGAEFEILWPPPQLPFEPTANESSIVLRVSYAGRSVLLAGDVEESAQRCLLGTGVDLTADVLVLPHHGSVRWNTPALVEAVSPMTVIRSASERNAISLDRLRPVIGNRPLYNTADEGAVQVILDEQGIEVSGFRAGLGSSR